MGKFIPREKLSKKARKELDSCKRLTWGVINPVTRKAENKKAYNRKKAQKGFENFLTEPFLLFYFFVLRNPSIRQLLAFAFRLISQNSFVILTSCKSIRERIIRLIDDENFMY